MISLCMIVKNEESVLEQCLMSVVNFVDEIIIVDTGSRDKTKEIAFKYTNKVFDFKWENDFSKARNYSIEKATNDWILILDADEVVEELNLRDLSTLYNNIDVVGRIKIVNEYEDNNGTKKYIGRVNRFFNRNFFEYEGIIHEQIMSKKKNSYKTKNIEITVNHIGYSHEVLKRTNKIFRNLELLKIAISKNMKDPYLYYQIGKTYFMAKDYKNSCDSFKKALSLLDNFEFEYIEDLIESYGYTLINLNLFDEALNLYAYEKYYKSSSDYLFLLGLIEMNNENFNIAIEKFLECTKCTEGKIEGINSYLPLYNIGVIFECLGFKSEAISYYNMCGNYSLAKNRMKLIGN